ncbi:MAG: hypothetical protein H0W12_01375 [Chitinophagaceae bacterium]|nr:hypothetical protein [Chitinophagaceae bacterium]
MQENNKIQDMPLNDRPDAVLNSFEGIQRATPQPYFYTRLVAKMQKRHESPLLRASSFITRPAFAFAVVCLIILMNVMVIFSNQNTVNTDDQTAQLATSDEYAQQTNIYDDIENNKP